jgi:hypothetical protein
MMRQQRIGEPWKSFSDGDSEKQREMLDYENARSI